MRILTNIDFIEVNQVSSAYLDVDGRLVLVPIYGPVIIAHCGQIKAIGLLHELYNNGCLNLSNVRCYKYTESQDRDISFDELYHTDLDLERVQ